MTEWVYNKHDKEQASHYLEFKEVGRYSIDRRQRLQAVHDVVDSRQALWHAAQAKIKIIFVSPYPTDPKKLPLPKKIYCNFSYKIFFFFSLLLIIERQKFHVLEGYIELLSDNAFNDNLLGIKVLFLQSSFSYIRTTKNKFQSIKNLRK